MSHKQEFDFYSKTNLHSYNLNESMRYQLGMLDRLDVYTRQHSENVANITCRLCEYLRLNKSFTTYCTICAYLHDIGKQFIPEEILQKPTALTPEEYEIMKTHTTKGYNICMGDKQLRSYANGALYHHESLDGSGYPNGIKGNEIPLEGQIIRIADEYDAIVNKRQYKSHVGIAETLKIIASEAVPRKHFEALDRLNMETVSGKVNPKIVKALFKVVIDDVEYEISLLYDYIPYLENNIKRLETIGEYNTKMQNATRDKDKAYYLEGIKILFRKGENLKKYTKILEEYKNALVYRKSVIEKLTEEIGIIKKMKIWLLERKWDHHFISIHLSQN